MFLSRTTDQVQRSVRWTKTHYRFRNRIESGYQNFFVSPIPLRRWPPSEGYCRGDSCLSRDVLQSCWYRIKPTRSFFPHGDGDSFLASVQLALFFFSFFHIYRCSSSHSLYPELLHSPLCSIDLVSIVLLNSHISIVSSLSLLYFFVVYVSQKHNKTILMHFVIHFFFEVTLKCLFVRSDLFFWKHVLPIQFVRLLRNYFA